MNLEEATLKALQEDDVQDYLANDEELKEDVQPNTYYYEVHIVEDEDNMSGFSVFFTSTKEMDEDLDSEAIITEAIKQNKIDNEDARYCDYVRQIDKEEYSDAIGEGYIGKKAKSKADLSYIDDEGNEIPDVIKKGEILTLDSLECKVDGWGTDYVNVHTEDGTVYRGISTRNLILLEQKNVLKTEAYTAREQFDAVMKKYSDNDKKEIKVVAETEHYILTVSRNKENSEGIYLSVTTGKDELDMLPDVYVRQDYKGKCEKVDINWSAMGNCSVAETEAFINALKEAIEFAKQIEGKDFSNEI